MESEFISGVSGGNDQLNQCRREKYWRELTDAEKIERMREMVHNLKISLKLANRELAHLRRHQHGANGEMLVEYDSYGIVESIGEHRRHDDDVYF